MYIKPAEDKKHKFTAFFIQNFKVIKQISFGAYGYEDYTTHKDKTRRDNYLKRHVVSEDWSKINAGSLSRWILWGNSTDINENIKHFKNKFNLK